MFGACADGGWWLCDFPLLRKTYQEFRLSGFPGVTPRITEYAQGTDARTSLGPHFQRPGRTVLENSLLDVPPPAEVLGADGGLGDFQRVFYSGKSRSHPKYPTPL